MIIWRGLGILVPLIAIVCLVLMEAAVGHTAYNAHKWMESGALIVSAVLVSLLGIKLDRRHSFFFIPVLYWGPILAVIGIVTLF